MTASRPGPRNLITDVAGILVGQAQDAAARSGVTVILPQRPAVAGADVRGGGPGVREIDAMSADTLVDTVDAIVLSGGSVYGLAAADGVTSWLGAQGRGFGFSSAPGVPRAPIVPAAILYDLANGGDKSWGMKPPYEAMGVTAARAAADSFALGTAGAGAGAMAGGLKGGIGSASIISHEGFAVGALAAVNSFGSAVAPGSRAFWASPYEIDGEFGGVSLGDARAGPDDWGLAKRDPGPRENTTLAVVATDVALTSAQARRIAIMAQDGLARAIRPVHAPFDGDVVFVVSTGLRPLPAPGAYTLSRLGSLAADCVARAVARGVYEATPWPGTEAPCWRFL